MNLINKRLEQKELFFDLKSKMNKEYVSGWYIIFKEDVCLYVGQSKNLSSRIATHLKGKYSTADKVLIYHSYEGSNVDLLTTERYLMNLFKPIENVLVDFSEKIELCDLECESSIMFTIESYNDKTEGKSLIESMSLAFNECIIFDNNDGLLINDDLPPTLYNMPKSIHYLSSLIADINNHKASK